MSLGFSRLDKLTLRALKKLRKACKKRRRESFWQQRLREIDMFIKAKQGTYPSPQA